MKNKKIRINYTDRDFNSIKNSLIEYAKKYYSNTYKDFNEASFGSLMLDSVSYIGDILSFYLDYSVNELFLNTSVEYDNVIKLGNSLGYKFRANPTSYGVAVFYLIVPSNTVGLGPDTRYLPVLARGSEFSSNGGNNFILNENIDFSDSKNEVVVAQINEDNGMPISYAIKAYGTVISGELKKQTVTVGAYEKFLKIEIQDENVAEIISVVDSDGHEYYEVEYLSQDIIYKEVKNNNSDRKYCPNILKPVSVPRRFILSQERSRSFIQFGYGTEEEITNTSLVDPSTVVMKFYGKDYVSDTSFDPNKMISTDKFGVAPSNTVLTIVYRANSSDNVNVSSNSLTTVVNPIFEFSNIVSLDLNVVNNIISTLEVSNESPIVGDITFPNSEELKHKILDTYATQNRAVTSKDYESIVYNMPPNFGAVKRCKIVQDNDSFKRNLNMYVISENENSTLIQTPDTIKTNIKTWIQNKKMVNDTVDILDAYIYNIGITFSLVSEEGYNKYSVLQACIEALKQEYQIPQEIGEKFSISNVYHVLKQVDGVLDVESVKVISKNGGNYSDNTFNIRTNLTPDGRYLLCPERGIFEIKFPYVDIVGTIK